MKLQLHHHMRISAASCLVLCGMLIVSCSPGKRLSQTIGLSILQEQMTGSFNSARQANRDSAYSNITLHMYPVWQSDEAHWLYVEQSVTTMQDKPYRQRIYRLTHMGGNQYASNVYRLQNEARFVGKWADPVYFDQFDQTILEERAGCTVYMTRMAGGAFKGQTLGETCKSTLHGAAYATSKVVIGPDHIESWDQGFDHEGNQVWGAMKGGYIFDRIN